MLGDTTNSKTRGLYNYDASFQFAREADPVTNTTSLYEAALTKFRTKGVDGYWLRRIGYDKSVPLAVGHKLRAFKVESHRPRTLDTDKGKPVWLEVKFGSLGYMSVPTAVIV